MALSVTIFFDDRPRRRSYRVRFRGVAYDNMFNVPRREFERAGVDSRAESKTGRKVAERWAYDKLAEIERDLDAVTVDGAFRYRWRGRLTDSDIEALVLVPADRRESMAARLAIGIPESSPPEISLEELFDLFVVKNPAQVSAETIDRYRELNANLARILGGKRKPSEIDDASALRFRNERLQEVDPRDGANIRHRTIANELAHLKRVLKHGRAWWRETGIVAGGDLTLPTVRRQEPLDVQLTDDELRRLFTAQFDHDTFRLQCIFQLALVSMLRVDNLMGARKEWWNLSKRWRHIPAEFMKGKGGEKRDLSVPISEWEAEIVAAAMRRSAPSNPYLFPNMNGRPSKWPRKTVRSVCAEDGIRYFGAHDLARYTGMAVLEERGVSKVVIKRYVGHAYISQRRDVTDDYVARNARLRSEDRLRQLCAVLDTFREEIGATEIPTSNRERGSLARNRIELSLKPFPNALPSLSRRDAPQSYPHDARASVRS